LINIDDLEKQLEIFERIIDEVLSVRDVENLARKAKAPKPTKNEEQQVKQFYSDARRNLSDQLSAKVDFKFLPKGNGKITIEFSNEYDLNRIMDLINK